MDALLALLARWGYVILAAFVVAEQVPLPVPAVPVLLGIGALAADGRMSIVVARGFRRQPRSRSATRTC